MNENSKIETFSEKVIRKTKNEPLVPLFAVITVGFLISGIRAFHSGQQRKSQMMMRARVLAQGCTIIAMSVGAFYGIKPHNRPKSMEEHMENIASKNN